MTDDDPLEQLPFDTFPKLHDLFIQPARPHETDSAADAYTVRGIPQFEEPESWDDYTPIVVEKDRDASRKYKRFAGYSWTSPLGQSRMIDRLDAEGLLDDASIFLSKPDVETLSEYCEQEDIREGYHLTTDVQGRKRPHFEGRSNPDFFHSSIPDSYWMDRDGAFSDPDFRAGFLRGDGDAEIDDAIGIKLDNGERNGVRIAIDWKYEDHARVHIAAHDHQPDYLDELYRVTDGQELHTNPSDILIDG